MGGESLLNRTIAHCYSTNKRRHVSLLSLILGWETGRTKNEGADSSVFRHVPEQSRNQEKNQRNVGNVAFRPAESGGGSSPEEGEALGLNTLPRREAFPCNRLPAEELCRKSPVLTHDSHVL